jgi:3'(2'), 5'-bisphosphate nucleotidase
MTDFAPNSAKPTDGFSYELGVAIKLVREAGAIVRTFYDVPGTVLRWKDPTEPVTEADNAADAYLSRELRRAFPDDGILTEESMDDLSRLDKQRVWIVDPLDGTAEFIAHNGEFSIMVGLVVNGEPVLGVVHQPIDDVLYFAERGKGAHVAEFDDQFPLRVSDRSEIPGFRLAVSRSHRASLVNTIKARLDTRREQSHGSVGLKIGLLARSQADYYVHPNPGTKEWDTCAAEIIIREAGGIMTDCWNRPLRYNQRDVVRRFGLLASNATRHDELSAVIADVLDEAGVEPDFGFA